MIGTLGLLGGISMGIGMLSHYKNITAITLNKEWDAIILSMGKSICNKQDETFELYDIVDKDYGCDFKVKVPFGFSFDDFEKILPILKTNLKAYDIIQEPIIQLGSIYCKMIKKEFNKEQDFRPVITKPYEVYLGMTEYYKDIIVDMRTNPHILVSGTTGSGKSVLISAILLNLVTNNKSSDLNLYISQISDKQDLKLFKDIEHTKFYTSELEEATKMFAYIVNEMKRRSVLINKHYDLDDVYGYNKIFPKDKLPYIYVASDEFSLYMVDDTDSNIDSYLKQQCCSYLKQIAKLGRSAGIFLIVGLQRPDKDSMPPIFKAQLNTRIAFAQNNGASSLVVIDNYDAVSLNPREAIVLFGSKRHKIVTQNLTKHLIKDYLSSITLDDIEYVKLNSYDYILTQAKAYKKKQKKKEEFGIPPLLEKTVNKKGKKGVL